MTSSEREVWASKVESALAGLIGCVCQIAPLVDGDNERLMRDTLVASLGLCEARAIRTGDSFDPMIEWFQTKIKELEEKNAG